MSNFRAEIRPSAAFLATLPTLRIRTAQQGVTDSFRQAAEEVEAGDFCLELKLSTPVADYWLCTRGLSTPVAGGPDSVVVNFITREGKTQELDEYLAPIYGPDNTKRLQGADYLKALDDYNYALHDQELKSPSEDRQREIERLHHEIDTVLRVLEGLPPADQEEEEEYEDFDGDAPFQPS